MAGTIKHRACNGLAGMLCGRGAGRADSELTRLAEVQREVAGIEQTAQEASARILAACEVLLDACEGRREAKDAAVENAAADIMAACVFEDLISQRAARAHLALDELLAKCLKRGRGRGGKPADAEASLEQDAVDALFSKDH